MIEDYNLLIGLPGCFIQHAIHVLEVLELSVPHIQGIHEAQA